MSDFKVQWPKTVALVLNRTLAPGKVLEDPNMRGDSEEVAYELGFSREEITWGTLEVEPKAAPQEMLALKQSYKCPIVGAYYLPRVVLRPLGGRMLPKGVVHVHLGGELIMEGSISEFLPDPEPLDCIKTLPWKKSKVNFRACRMLNGGAEGGFQIGFMMPTLSKVEIQLGQVTAEEKMTLEIGIIAAYYSTKKSEVESFVHEKEGRRSSE